MFYLNGVEDLEKSAECALIQMLALKPTKEVTLTIQLAMTGIDAPHAGRVAQRDIPCPLEKGFNRVPYWKGTRRVAVVNGKTRTRAVDGTFLGSNLDMRNPANLAGFVRWSVSNYPARHNILIIKDHGAGKPYLLFAKSARLNSFINSALIDITPELKAKLAQKSKEPGLDVHKPVILEPDSNLLLNSQIRNALKSALGRRRLDIIGFDSCYKAMLETGYAMRDVARTLVASEAIQFDYAWDNLPWLTELARHPKVNRLTIARKMLVSFQKRQAEFERQHSNEDIDPATLAAVDLDGLDAILSPLDLFSDILATDRFPAKMATNARNACQPLEDESFDIDLNCFVTHIIDQAGGEGSETQEEINQLSKNINDTIKTIVPDPIINYKAKKLGASGLAIYFPTCQEDDLLHDPNHASYDPLDSKAIPFAKQHSWAAFIQRYLKDPNIKCPPPPDGP